MSENCSRSSAPRIEYRSHHVLRNWLVENRHESCVTRISLDDISRRRQLSGQSVKPHRGVMPFAISEVC
jgi:hypothetical protein